jgi:pyruvate dehydrogenase E1 component
VKGYGMGASGEAQNPTHQQKKMDMDSLRAFRDRFQIPIADADLEHLPFYKPADDSPEMKYLHARRTALGGYVPTRQRKAAALEAPPLSTFQAMLEATGEREISTTMAFVRLLTTLLRDKTLGRHIVPIIPDEARTFGMEGLFRTVGIYSSVGQLYEPVDSDQVMYYREDKGARFWKKASTKPARFQAGSPLPRRTAPTTCR